MAQLRQDIELFDEQDTEIVVIGPEDKEAFRKYWLENKLTFLGLPDPSHRVLRLFGQEVNLFKLGRMPAQVIIDKQGITRYAHYGHAMSDIPENSELLSILAELNSSEVMAES